VEQIRETLHAWIADAVERLRQDPTNAQRAARVVERYLSEAGIEGPDDLRAPGLMAWLRREALGKARRTVRNELAAVRQWSRFLEATGTVERAPFESVKVARCDSDDGCDAITDEQAEALIANAREECSSDRWQIRANAPARLAAYMLMLDCGLRIGEVRAQRWDDVDLQRRLMRITRDKAKRRDVIPLPLRVAAVLRWLRRAQAAEGVETGGKVVPCGPNAKKMRADLDRVGCAGEGGRFHRLRKHAITSRAMQGWDVWRLTKWSRHRDPKTTMRYVRPTAEDLRGIAG